MTDHTAMPKVSRARGNFDGRAASLDAGRETADRGGELRWAAACVGNGAAEWSVCEPTVHMAAASPRGPPCRGR